MEFKTTQSSATSFVWISAPKQNRGTTRDGSTESRSLTPSTVYMVFLFRQRTTRHIEEESVPSRGRVYCSSATRSLSLEQTSCRDRHDSPVSSRLNKMRTAECLTRDVNLGMTVSTPPPLPPLSNRPLISKELRVFFLRGRRSARDTPFYFCLLLQTWVHLTATGHPLRACQLRQHVCLMRQYHITPTFQQPRRSNDNSTTFFGLKCS